MMSCQNGDKYKAEIQAAIDKVSKFLEVRQIEINQFWKGYIMGLHLALSIAERRETIADELNKKSN